MNSPNFSPNSSPSSYFTVDSSSSPVTQSSVCCAMSCICIMVIFCSPEIVLFRF